MGAKKPFRKNTTRKEEEPKVEQSSELRLNKYLAHSGVASRRKSDEYIAQGLVKVNGKVVTEVGLKINVNDKVQYNGKIVKPEKKAYVLLNKPSGFITNTDDEKDRKTIMNLLGKVSEKMKLSYDLRLYPVGRLDRNTTGVLLVTNDGELSLKLQHPSSKVKKVYKVTLNKPLEENHFNAIKEGTDLDDGTTVNILAMEYVTNDGMTLGVEVNNGNLRKVFEKHNYLVEKMDRMSYAGLTKKDLPRGKWRLLTDREVTQLKLNN